MRTFQYTLVTTKTMAHSELASVAPMPQVNDKNIPTDISVIPKMNMEFQHTLVAPAALIPKINCENIPTHINKPGNQQFDMKVMKLCKTKETQNNSDIKKNPIRKLYFFKLPNQVSSPKNLKSNVKFPQFLSFQGPN